MQSVEREKRDLENRQIDIYIITTNRLQIDHRIYINIEININKIEINNNKIKYI